MKKETKLKSVFMHVVQWHVHVIRSNK